MLTSDDGKQPGSDSSNSPCLSVQEYFDLTPCNSGLVAILSAHTSLQLTFALSEKTCVCLATEDKQDSRGRLKTWAVVFCAAAVWLVIASGSYLCFGEALGHTLSGAGWGECFFGSELAIQAFPRT